MAYTVIRMKLRSRPREKTRILRRQREALSLAQTLTAAYELHNAEQFAKSIVWGAASADIATTVRLAAWDDDVRIYAIESSSERVSVSIEPLRRGGTTRKQIEVAYEAFKSHLKEFRPQLTGGELFDSEGEALASCAIVDRSDLTDSRYWAPCAAAALSWGIGLPVVDDFWKVAATAAAPTAMALGMMFTWFRARSKGQLKWEI